MAKQVDERTFGVDVAKGWLDRLWPILLKSSISDTRRNSQEFFFTLARNAEIECATLSAPRQDFHALPTTPRI
jgi:hypothetical protein